jgi:hypothetical protein
MSNKDIFDFDVNEFEEELENDVGYPEGWRPEKGDFILGELVGYGSFDGDYGVVPIANVKAKKGTTSPDGEKVELEEGKIYGVWLSHAVLKRKFEDLKPVPGEIIGILRKDLIKPKTKGYKPYPDYGVKVHDRATVGSYVPEFLREAKAPAPEAQPQDVPQSEVEATDDELPF